MDKKSFIAFIALILLVIAGYWFWKKQSVTKDVVKIGAILPLTGDLAKIGEYGKNGLRLAESYINSTEHIKLKISIEDGQGKPSSSINALNKILFENQNNIPIFSILSPVDLSILPIQKQKQFIFISHSTHPNLSNVNNLVFRHSSTVNQEVKMLSEYLIENKGLVAIVSNDDYGIAFQNNIISKFKDIKIIKIDKIDNSLNSILEQIVKYKPTKIIVCVAGKNSSSIIKKLREREVNTEVITTLAFKASGADLLLENDSNLTMIDFEKIQIHKPFDKIVNEFAIKNGREPNPAEIIFFNSAILTYYSTINAKDKTPLSIVNYLKNNKINILGGNLNITSGNDIIPNLVFIKK